MTNSDLNELERDIERSRARLDHTITRLQDKLTVSGVVDDVLGTMRTNDVGGLYDTALAALRRNPVPVMIAAVGIGWLIYRMGSEAERRRRIERLERDRLEAARLGMAGVDYSDPGFEDPDLPVAGTVRSRVYEPASPSPLDSMRDAPAGHELNARP